MEKTKHGSHTSVLNQRDIDVSELVRRRPTGREGAPTADDGVAGVEHVGGRGQADGRGVVVTEDHLKYMIDKLDKLILSFYACC